MSQIKIYGLRASLCPIRAALSDAVHQCVVEVLKIPTDKRFHRFILLDEEDFFFPDDRTPAYTIIEIMMMRGRKEATKKKLIRLLFQEIHQRIGISTADIEISLWESPAYQWGFRGMTGDEVMLNYSVDV